MRVTTRGVQRLAAEAGIPETLADRHIDGLTTFALLVAKRDRKVCRNAIRAWFFSKDLAKPPLFEILDEVTEDTL